MFFKIVVVKNFTIFRRKHVLESLFNKVAGFDACDVIKETPRQVFSCEICNIVKNKHLFYRAPPEAASVKRQYDLLLV